jgi:hypothetical protein
VFYICSCLAFLKEIAELFRYVEAVAPAAGAARAKAKGEEPALSDRGALVAGASELGRPGRLGRRYRPFGGEEGARKKFLSWDRRNPLMTLDSGKEKEAFGRGFATLTRVPEAFFTLACAIFEIAAPSDFPCAGLGKVGTRQLR